LDLSRWDDRFSQSIDEPWEDPPFPSVSNDYAVLRPECSENCSDYLLSHDDTGCLAWHCNTALSQYSCAYNTQCLPVMLGAKWPAGDYKSDALPTELRQLTTVRIHSIRRFHGPLQRVNSAGSEAGVEFAGWDKP
jgi:hypothetical protein